MHRIMGAYMSYLSRAQPVLEASPALPSSRYAPSFWSTTAVSTCAFLSMQALFPACMARVLGKRWHALSPVVQAKMVNTLAGSVHHIVVSVASAAALWNDVQEQSQGEGHFIDYTHNMRLVGFTGGYFVADTLHTLATEPWTLDFIFHHGAALLIIFRGVTVSLGRWVPHVLICETSSIAFNIMWILRQLQLSHTPAYNYATLAFVLLFTITRIVNLPVVMVTVWNKFSEDLNELGRAKWLLWGIVGLQFYWWFKILRQLKPLLATLVAVVHHRIRVRAAPRALQAAAAQAAESTLDELEDEIAAM